VLCRLIVSEAIVFDPIEDGRWKFSFWRRRKVPQRGEKLSRAAERFRMRLQPFMSGEARLSLGSLYERKVLYLMAQSGIRLAVPQTGNPISTCAKIITAASLGTNDRMVRFLHFWQSLPPLSPVTSSGTTNPNESILLWLATYATGFLVRPFGAIVFGRIGDLIGRKYTFLVTMTLMGLSTRRDWLSCQPMPAIGIVAPLILLGLRLFAGASVGGEGTAVRQRILARTRAGRQARLLYEFHPGHGHRRLLHFINRDPGQPRSLLSGPSAVLPGKTLF